MKNFSKEHQVRRSVKKDKEKPKGTDYSKIVKRTCKHCKCRYEIKYYNALINQKQLNGVPNPKNKNCGKEECNFKAAMIYLDKKKIVNEKRLRKARKDNREKLKKELGIKTKQHQNPLQKTMNAIARELDKDLPCLAYPTYNGTSFDGGHVIPVSRYPSLRYNIWNIHAQGTNSNRSQKDDLLMLEGFEIRFGKEKREWLETLHLEYPIVGLSKEEEKHYLKIANKLLRGIKKGLVVSRDEVNDIIGIYK